MLSKTSEKKWRPVPTSIVLAYVAQEAEKFGFIKKVILFGSRARGNARPYSDYDFAVELLPDTPILSWLAFAENLDDEAPTLCKLSLLQLKKSIRPELLSRIAQEGKVIYER